MLDWPSIREREPGVIGARVAAYSGAASGRGRTIGATRAA
jgi:hypothetical protein